jgi:hypothetical protein
LTVCTISCLLGLVACERTQEMNPYPPFITLPFDTRIAGIPIILVGRVIKTERITQPKASIWDRGQRFQLHRASIQVEDVLQGNVTKGTADLFYFMDLNQWGSPD